jgi:hypothetical protein
MPRSNNKTDIAIITNKLNKSSERPPLLNANSRNKEKVKEKKDNREESKEKNILLGNLFLGGLNKNTAAKSDIEKSSSLKNKKNLKQEKIGKPIKQIDNSLDNDNKDALEFIDLMQEQGNNNNNNNKEKKIENADLHNHLSIAGGFKITPNITQINNLIANSQQALNQQKNLLQSFSEMNKKLCASEFEVQKLTGKLDSEEFAGFSDKYSASLDKVIEKLKNHSEEMENIKCTYIKLFNFLFLFIDLLFHYIKSLKKKTKIISISWK